MRIIGSLRPGCWLQLLVLGNIVAAGQTADAIYYNGRIVTLWDTRPVAEAMAIRGNDFLKVGSNGEIFKTGGPSTKKTDLRGRCVIPGLIDSHTHPITAAMATMNGPVPVLHSIADIQAYIRQQAAVLPSGQIIHVPKVFATRLRERRYPTRYELDEAAGGRLAVADKRICGGARQRIAGSIGCHARHAAAVQRQDPHGQSWRADGPCPGGCGIVAAGATQPAPHF